MSQNIELVIFDWDGTLIDSEANIVSCMQAMGRELGLPPLHEDAIRNIIGLGMHEALRELYPQYSHSEYTKMVDAYRTHFFTSEPSQPFEHTEYVLQQLKQQEFMLAVATGKGRQGLDKALQCTGFDQYFTVTRCAGETRSKPHPQMLEEILDALGVDVGKALMVGDTEYDLQMAANIGMPSVGVSYGVHSVDRLKACNPLAILDCISGLPAWLRGEKFATG